MLHRNLLILNPSAWLEILSPNRDTAKVLKISFSTDFGDNAPYQEPITRSLHLPYYSSEPTLSRIFLFLEAPPTEVFAGVFVITNHERAAVTHCLQVTGNQSYLHLHGLHDSKRKLMFFVHRLIPQRFDRF